MNAYTAPSGIGQHLARAAGVLGLLAGLSALPAVTQANDQYPSRPVHLVVGFPAGGGTDWVARSIAHKMEEALGTTMVVENKPGANANIAAATVARAPADGYTLVYNTSAIILNPLLSPKQGIDALEHLTPIGLAVNQPLLMVTFPESGLESVADVVAYLQKQPGGLNYASGGTGNITHLSMVMFERSVGVRATHVPYSGDASALPDLIGGRIHLYMTTVSGLVPLVRDQRVRALAVGSLKRLSVLPDVPTLDETAAKGLELTAWSGVMAPAGTPPDIVAKLNTALRSALANKELRADFAARGVEITASTAEDYATFLAFERARWSKLIRDARIRIE